MIPNDNLSRFLGAQEGVYDQALREIKLGKKTGHWMWFMFPQLHGLGYSTFTKFYAIKTKNEALAYLNHAVLGNRLIEISTELLKLSTQNPVAVFGNVDSMKLKSCMTLFSLVEDTNPIFIQVLNKFFDGSRDESTVRLLQD